MKKHKAATRRRKARRTARARNEMSSQLSNFKKDFSVLILTEA